MAKTHHLVQLRGLWRQGADETLGRIADRCVTTKPSTTSVTTPSRASAINRKPGAFRRAPMQTKTVKQNESGPNKVAFSDLNTLLLSASRVDAVAITKPGPVSPGVAFFQDPQVGTRRGEHALKNYVGGDFLSNDQLTDFAAATWLHGHPKATDVERRTVDASQGNDSAVLRDYLNWQISAERLTGLDPVETVVVHGQNAAARFQPSGNRCIIQTQQPNHLFAFRRGNNGQWRRIDSRIARQGGLANQQPNETPSEFPQHMGLARQDQRIRVI